MYAKARAKKSCRFETPNMHKRLPQEQPFSPWFDKCIVEKRNYKKTAIHLHPQTSSQLGTSFTAKKYDTSWKDGESALNSCMIISSWIINIHALLHLKEGKVSCLAFTHVERRDDGENKMPKKCCSADDETFQMRYPRICIAQYSSFALNLSYRKIQCSPRKRYFTVIAA